MLKRTTPTCVPNIIILSKINCAAISCNSQPFTRVPLHTTWSDISNKSTPPNPHAESAKIVCAVVMAGILFEDIFDVKDIDPDGKKFERGKLLL